jgi:hypothetical protein
MATGDLRRIRDALDRLDQLALIRLAERRGVRGARSNDERRETLARSYKGDAASFVDDLQRADLQAIFRYTIERAGLSYFVSEVESASRQRLATILLSLLTADALPEGVELDEDSHRRAEARESAARSRREAQLRLPDSLDLVLPSWLARLDTAPTSRDPLGLQARAARFADQLLPGLNVFTSRARYYSFLCWALSQASRVDAGAQLDCVHRLEKMLVLGEALLHADEPRACYYVGRRRGAALVRENAASPLWDLPTRILKNQSSNGALRLYRTSLADLGLLTEDDVAAGIGLRLTPRGEQLAEKYGERVDPLLVRWAIEGNGQKKRRESIESGARDLCMSREMGKYERRYIVEALFGRDVTSATEHAQQRRETTRLLVWHGLLRLQDAEADVASEDADAISEGAADSVAEAESAGNWAVVRAVLEMPPTSELRTLQIASAYELLGIGLNGLLWSMLEPLRESGRLSLTTWLDRVGAVAGSGFADSTAASRRVPRSLTQAGEEIFSMAKTPFHDAVNAFDLILGILRDPKLLAWLSEAGDGFVDRVLDYRGQLATKTPRELLEALVRDFALRHREESTRKGKGEWFQLDGTELVRCEPRQLRPLVHSLRFAQLASLARDLRLRPEEVADAS